MKFIIYFISLFFLCMQTLVYPHGGGGEMGGNVGPKKGIQAVSHEEGMTVSPQAIKRLGLESTTLTGNAPWNVPKEGIIFSKDDKFIYLVKNGKYKAIQVEATSLGNGNYQVNSWQLKTNDQILIKGTALLRIAELDASSGEEEEEDEHNHGKEKHEEHEEHDKHEHEEEGHHDK
jgi:hypothetical protein